MEVIVVKTQEEAAEKTYELIHNQLEKSELKTLGLATGSTPLKLYAKMREEKPDVSEVTTVNLDEYVGLEPTDPQSYRFFMDKELFETLFFKETHVPN